MCITFRHRLSEISFVLKAIATLISSLKKASDKGMCKTFHIMLKKMDLWVNYFTVNTYVNNDDIINTWWFFILLLSFGVLILNIVCINRYLWENITQKYQNDFGFLLFSYFYSYFVVFLNFCFIFLVSVSVWEQVINLYPHLISCSTTNCCQISESLREALFQYHDLLKPPSNSPATTPPWTSLNYFLFLFCWNFFTFSPFIGVHYFSHVTFVNYSC